MVSFAVILPAGGSSSRFGADKLTAVLRGRTIIGRSLEAFTRRRDVPMVVVAGALTIDAPRTRCVSGGDCRARSVLNALNALPSEIEWVAIHDAARPLVSQDLIDRVASTAFERNAATAPALPAALTIKQATGPLPSQVLRTLPRDQLWAMQTPQLARRATLLEAYASCTVPLEQITDDVQLLELSGQPVWLVEGEEHNIKITRPIDLELAELLLERHPGV